MDVPVNVPIDDPNADTEWNDILRKHGIIPEKPKSPTPIIQEAILEAQKRTLENRLENKELDELDELEDEEDEAFLQQYRQKRLQELLNLQRTSVHNQVYPLQKPDYTRDVTEASSKYYVCVLLTSSLGTNIESRLLIEFWRELAQKYGDIKFCEMRADLCIEGYPERNAPTILIYRNGDIVKQIITLREMKGVNTKVEDLENMLVESKVLPESDFRLRQKDRAKARAQESEDKVDDEEYDDWD